VIRDNQSVTCIMPDSKSVMVGRSRPRQLFPVVPRDLASIEKYYRFENIGDDRMTGVMAQVVTITPRDDYRYGYRFWIAKDSKMLLKSDLNGVHGAPIEQVMGLAKTLANLGWHLQIHMESSLIGAMTPALERAPVPIVIDHMGRIDASKGLDQPDFADLLSLLRNRNIWVKVSGCERASRQSSPWQDAIPFARKLVAEFGDRTLWGSDWPHPNLKEIPDDGVMVDNLAEIAPSEKQRQALLVDNPARFYGFKA